MTKTEREKWQLLHRTALDKALLAMKNGDALALKHATVAAVAFDKLRLASIDDGDDYL